MTSYRTDRTEPTEKLLQEKLIMHHYHTDLKLTYMLPIMHYTTRRQSTATSNPSGTTDAIFTKLPRPLAKDRKNTLANWRPI